MATMSLRPLCPTLSQQGGCSQSRKGLLDTQIRTSNAPGWGTPGGTLEMLVYPDLPDKLFQGEANPAQCVSHTTV